MEGKLMAATPKLVEILRRLIIAAKEVNEINETRFGDRAVLIAPRLLKEAEALCDSLSEKRCSSK